jgi:hypothetical protein
MKMKAARKQRGSAPAKAASENNGNGIDHLVKGGAVLLAVAAAMFPWYVFFNQDKFGVSVSGWEQLRDLKGFRHREVVEVPPMTIERDQDSDADTDMLYTATVPEVNAGKGDDDEDGTLQPFPGKSSFRLLQVANGRAIIEDANGMYLVQAGSTLPDNSKLATLTQRDGKWVIITSTGQVYERAE